MKEDKKESNKNKNVDELTKELLQYRKQYVQNLKELKQTEEELPELEHKIQELQKDYATAREEFNKTLKRSWWSILPGAIFDLSVDSVNYLRGKEPTETAIARTDKELKELFPKKEQAENRLKELKENNEKLKKQIEETKKQIEEAEEKERDEKKKKEAMKKERMENEKKRIIENAKKKEIVQNMEKKKIENLEKEKTIQSKEQKINNTIKQSISNAQNVQNVKQTILPVNQAKQSMQFNNDDAWLLSKINGIISYEEFEKICDFCNNEESCRNIQGKQDMEELINVLQEHNINTFQSFHDTLVNAYKQTLQDNNILPDDYDDGQHNNYENFANYTNFLTQTLSQYNDYDKRLFNIIKNNDDQRVNRAEQKLNELEQQDKNKGFFAKILSFFFDYKNLQSKIEKARIEYRKALKQRTKNQQNMLKFVNNKSDVYTDVMMEGAKERMRNMQFGGMEEEYNNYTMQQSMNDYSECSLENGTQQQNGIY